MSNISNQKIVQYYPLGDAAIVLQFGDEISKDINAVILNIAAWLDEYTFEGFVEYVPAFTSITIYYEPWVVRYAEVLSMLREMLEEIEENENAGSPAMVTIPVYYGGASGPDLDDVARFHKMSTDEVIALHTQPEYLVYMIGFAPGFPYLGGMDERIATPRKESPRAKVPKGSVGIAGSQTGVYPLETPGGWQIIGQTPLELFDLRKEEPALLRAGQKIRFSSITEDEFFKLKADYGH
ncbi:5-oxoprolinase subunit PxpB [Pedobacter frigoris]|uniref:5-oxoprolinase subunit PxpB n=1 Tax=Pedobacter frigoris TaxID=2571272 RepID=UPI002931C26C|nr:5-oxoprolinase subunit PxpB [Pedobacter frigoris]